ncbi:MAG: hypothetical protein HQK65_13400 [Desulfamplus sp.]|nr:hypothetical protein [Desulfamplus sp.]
MINKDLSGFLKRELDFYIKNEVMHFDDIENADAPAVENYLPESQRQTGIGYRIM